MIIEAAASPESVVSMRGVRKAFDRVEVLRGVDFELHEGEVHALVGGNGAGKSTLMKILQGVHRPDSGEIYVRGRRVTLQSPRHARSVGLGMVFQEFSLSPTLTVGQNIFLGREPRRFGLINDRTLNRRAGEILRGMGTDLDPTATLGELSVGYWQLTEIAKALSMRAQVLILDEPTASLPYHEVEQLFDTVGRMKNQGVSVIYISHRMAEIERIADRITVLRDGLRVLTDQITAVSSEKIIESIVGRGILHDLSRQQRTVSRTASPVLVARNLRSGKRLVDVSLDLYRGEVLGLAGLIGSGRTELARCLFGLDRLAEGNLALHGRPLKLHSPADAIRSGIMLVPENRQLQGLALDHSVRDNLLLPSLGDLRRGPLLNDRIGSRMSTSLVDRLSIQGASRGLPVRRLSGGNQQKIVIAKWLGLKQAGHQLHVLILDEPTTGVDIGAKTEIMQLILELADAGTAVIMISSELEELVAVSDRVLVVRAGRVHSELAHNRIKDEKTLQLAMQGG